jgi:hypothetical protein
MVLTTIVIAKVFEVMEDAFGTKGQKIRHRTIPDDILCTGKKRKPSNKLMNTVEGMVGTKTVPVVERRS